MTGSIQQLQQAERVQPVASELASGNALEQFEAHVVKHPDAVAIESGSAVLTYARLNQRAEALASLLEDAGVGPGSLVALQFGPSLEAIVSMFAAWKVGAGYLPLGAECPAKRALQILKSSGAKALLTTRDRASELPLEIPVLYPSELATAPVRTRPASRASVGLAYVIYTSGTTGEPKGVMVGHASLANYLRWAAGQYLGAGPEVMPFFTSISFDMTVTSIFLPLTTGNKVVVYETQEGGAQFAVERVLKDPRVTLVKLTPTHLKLVKGLSFVSSKIAGLIVGGEELTSEVARSAAEAFDRRVAIYNEYGPTEATVGCMIHRYEERHAGPTVPIGQAISGARIYVLDEALHPVSAGVLGEIYIGGAVLARGYLDQPERTAASFIDDPQVRGAKMYRTGDLAQVGGDGVIVYKGRRDSQLKVRGFRVETAEIEEAIVSYQRRVHKRSLLKLSAPLAVDIRKVPRCRICINRLDESSAEEMKGSVCRICREYEEYKERAKTYFRTPEQLYQLIKSDPSFGKNAYDAVLCFSGGKDSTYALHKLAEQGIRMLAFTFDNGYISKVAFDNMRRATELLGVDLVVGDAKEINSIFVDSLLTESNVCNGCFKSINTLALALAQKHGVKFVINGLSRGQIFDINVHGLFKLGIFDDDAIEAQLQQYRKLYFSTANRVSRLLNAGVTDEVIEGTSFIDYFRYDDVVTKDVVKYITHERRAWTRPPDTGSSSSNCRLNDASIYFHVKNKGDHFYTSQLSWDVRLGTITREEAFDEISEFELGEKSAQNVLKHIGFYNENAGACVVGEKAESFDGTELHAYVVADAMTDFSELRSHLVAALPEYMVPSKFFAVDRLPMAASGKIDRAALASSVVEVASPTHHGVVQETASRSETEAAIVEIWSRVLAVAADNIGPESDFFELGGHSFKYVKMMSEIKARFGVTLSMDLSEKTTVGWLKSQLEPSVA